MVELITKWTERAKKARERLDICVQCEHLEKQYYVCKKCGCFLKGKTMFPSSSCPIGKWDKYSETNTET
jgi:rubrerythrin